MYVSLRRAAEGVLANPPGQVNGFFVCGHQFFNASSSRDTIFAKLVLL
jgi:hypothetical protein